MSGKTDGMSGLGDGYFVGADGAIIFSRFGNFDWIRRKIKSLRMICPEIPIVVVIKKSRSTCGKKQYPRYFSFKEKKIVQNTIFYSNNRKGSVSFFNQKYD